VLIRNGQAAESMQPPVAEIVASEEVAEAVLRGCTLSSILYCP
jgi:hypothetical protein